jgi:hypothetical protein
LKTLVKALFFLLSILAAPAAAGWYDDAWFDPAFLESHGLAGGSGFINLPSPEVLPAGLMAGGLHRYRAKVSRGFYGFAEAGLSVELEGWKLGDIEKNNLFNGRLALLTPARNGVALAVGADQVGPEDFGATSLGFIARDEFKDEDRYYAMLGLVPPRLPMVYVAGGYVGGRRGGSPVAALGVVIIPGLLGLAEYDGVGTNVGARALLSTQIKLDLSLVRLQSMRREDPFANVLQQNLRFGVSYSEVWP